MMNVLAMGLVLSSLVTAGFWSPTPDNPTAQEEAILKERHRVLVVEYEQERNNPAADKSSHREFEVSTPSLEDKSYFSEAREKLSSGAEEVKEKAREASSVLPNLGLGLSGDEPRKGPGDLICDAYGKCKHKIASALGKTKDTIVHTTEQVSGKAQDVKEGAKDTVRGIMSQTAEQVKEGAHDTVSGVSDKAKETLGGLSDKAGKIKQGAEDRVGHGSDEAYKLKEGAKEAVRDAAGKVKETIATKLGGGGVGEAATGTAEQAEDGAGTLLDTSDTLGKDVKKNVSMTTTTHASDPHKGEQTGKGDKGILNRGREAAGEMAKTAKDEGRKELKEILGRGREVARDMVCYAMPMKSVDGALEVVRLLGLSTAYGMCVWVTFLASYVLAGALPKQQFAVVQSKMYPVYFRAMASSIAVALLGYLLSRRGRLFSDKGAMFQGINLLAPLLMVLFNSIYLEPRATKVMFERMKTEKEEGRGQDSSVMEPSRVGDTLLNPSSGEGENVIRQGRPVEQDRAKQRIIGLNETLKKLNLWSSLLNVLTLVSLSLHLVQLGRSIHLSC